MNLKWSHDKNFEYHLSSLFKFCYNLNTWWSLIRNGNTEPNPKYGRTHYFIEVKVFNIKSQGVVNDLVVHNNLNK